MSLYKSLLNAWNQCKVCKHLISHSTPVTELEFSVCMDPQTWQICSNLRSFAVAVTFIWNIFPSIFSFHSGLPPDVTCIERPSLTVPAKQTSLQCPLLNSYSALLCFMVPITTLYCLTYSRPTYKSWMQVKCWSWRCNSRFL